MTGRLSNTFPEMTEDELAIFKRHGGSYAVSHFHPKLNCVVGSTCMSIEAFIDLNGLEDTPETKREIAQSLAASGTYTTIVHGHNVSIYIPS